MDREILLGDEAIGLGAIHSGLSGVYGYPGTPSTEIFEFVERRTKKAGDVHAFWSTNEKVAYEEALGMSWAGKRALVCMKHVGLNVAADAFMNSAVTGTNGGLVLAVADDPGMHSSQNEQDSRFFAQFALIPCFEPRNQQECYDMMFEAFELSEELSVPVMIRLVTRIAHSRAGVATREQLTQNELDPDKQIKKWTLLPGNARVQYKQLTEKQPELLRRAEDSPHNSLDLRGKTGVIVCGLASNYLHENLEPDHDLSILSICQYPLPANMVRSLVDHVDDLLILEDGYPLVESTVRGLFGLENVRVTGRMTGEVPRTGELNPDIVREALGIAPSRWPPPTIRRPRSPTVPRRCARGARTPTRSDPSTRPSTTSTTRRSSPTSAATPWPRCRRWRRSTAASRWAPRSAWRPARLTPVTRRRWRQSATAPSPTAASRRCCRPSSRTSTSTSWCSTTAPSA